MTDVEMNLVIRCLAGEATDGERMKLKEWLLDEGNRIHFEELSVIWNMSGRGYTVYSPDLKTARARIGKGIRQTFKVNPWVWAGKAAAILVIMVGVIWSIGEYAPSGLLGISMEEIETGPTMDSVTLSDGSTVWLNKESTLKYPLEFTGAERRVYLTGEAFFQIARDSKTPFIVEAQGTLTRVLGTSFNIKTNQANVSVNVRTGEVMFSQRNNAENFALLQKNQLASFSVASGVIKKTVLTDAYVPLWRSGSLSFKNTPLWQVVEKLSAYYDTSIQLDSTTAGKFTLTSTFDDQSVEQVLEVVCATLDMRLENIPSGYRLIRADTLETSKE